MQHDVKYQLERAQDALRTALELGAKKENATLLKHIATKLSDIESLFFVFPEKEKKENDTIKINGGRPWSYYDSVTNVSSATSFDTMAAQPVYTYNAHNGGTDVISFS